MKNLTALLLGITLFISSNALAQGAEEKETKPYIDVTGVAELEIVPDQIYIEIVLQEKDKVTIEMQEEKLKEALKSIGVDMKDLYLSDANSNYIKVSKWKSKDVITNKQYILKVTNANMVGQVFQQLDKLDITNADIKNVSHSKMDSLKREVKIMAIKIAKKKADYLLAAIGEQAGKPMIVQEVENKGNYSSNTGYGSRNVQGHVNARFLDDDDKVGGNVEFKKIKIQSAIFVKFLIK
jgi:uncharacterized protein